MNRIIALVILLVPILMGIYAYQDLPDQLTIHFGPTGEPDGYQSKQTFFPAYVLLSAIVMGVAAGPEDRSQKRKLREVC
ncbi:DUF1648 domain-containing protein [Brevibacillus composti]|uniref:DUF1648 domain-containing protein n=1 Tax=Brevibacillus composti TaxID=2796470 RepID=A0ABX7Z0X4_9BACL|nr:DUF1648 domain-containing protein [Brevibacillus composti]QUO40667.1 DUF1648 domain-containing protein [Brevibacillus composti]